MVSASKRDSMFCRELRKTAVFRLPRCIGQLNVTHLDIKGEFERLKFRWRGNCRRLLSLRLKSAALKYFDLRSVARCGLEELDLSGGNLQRLEQLPQLRRMKTLKKLDLQGNRIGGFPFDAMRGSVRDLRLQDNDIAGVNFKKLMRMMFSGANRIDYFNLNENPFRCDYMLTALDRFHRDMPGCTHVRCFFCNWLKMRVLIRGRLSSDLKYIKNHRRHCYQ